MTPPGQMVMDWQVTPNIVYRPQLCFGPYTIFGVSCQSIIPYKISLEKSYIRHLFKVKCIYFFLHTLYRTPYWDTLRSSPATLLQLKVQNFT